MNILVTGGTGMIGRPLTRLLLEGGHQVTVLTRSPDAVELPAGARQERWDGRAAQGWGRLVEEADAIINLAGANIGARPWSNARKQAIRQSRVDAGGAIVEAVRQAARRPRVVLQISGIGYYGDTGDRPVDESAPAGQGFQTEVVRAWEAASAPIADLGPRLVVMRTAPVLDRKGGMLAPFVLQNRLFAGGPLGSGRQWVSWIHIRDLLAAFRFFLEREDAQGVFNVCAPQPLTNADFGRAVARAMGRPFWVPAPAFAIKIALGEMSEMVLQGQRALPTRLLEMGFRFEFDTLQKALQDLIQ